MTTLPTLDPLLHQAVRTRLAVLLYQQAYSFAQLKSALKLSDGNLDAHLKKLSANGYLQSQMVTDNRPYTRYELSKSGKKAFKEYRAAIDTLMHYRADTV